MTQSDWQRVRDNKVTEYINDFDGMPALVAKRISWSEDDFKAGADFARAHTISEILESAEFKAIEEFIRRAEGFMFEVTQPDQGDKFAEFDEAMRPVKTALALLRNKLNNETKETK